MALREWAPNTSYGQGDCVVIPDGAGGYMGDANGSKTWLLCCVGSGASVDVTPSGVSGAVKTQNEWAILFEGTGTDGNINEATVMPATLSGGAGPDGTIRWACGIAYFLDTGAAVNGNGSYASPYNSADTITATQIGSADGTNSTRHLYIKRGTTVLTDSGGGDWLGRGSSRRHYATISDYGSGAIPKINASATAATGQHAITITKAGANPARFCLVENVEVFNAGGHGVSLFLGLSDASISQNDIIVRNVVAHDNGESGIHALTGGAVDRSASSTNFTVEDCICYNNGHFGIVVREWWDNAVIRRNTVYNNGLNAPNGAYGISTMGNYLSFTVTDWTQLSSSPNVWQRVFSRANNVIAGRFRRSDQTEAILTTGVFGSLSTAYTVANSGSTVQVCLGAGETPNGNSFWLCYNYVKNVLIENNVVRSTNDFRAAASRFDGDGLGIDQFSQNIAVRRNVVENNGGCGLIANQPNGIYITGNVFANNGAQKGAANQVNAGILVQHQQTAAVVVNNVVVGQTGNGIRTYTPNGIAVTVRNNLVHKCGGAALFGTSTAVDGGFVETYNWLSANASNSQHVTLSGTDTISDASALIDSSYAPKSAGYSLASPNPLAVAGGYYAGVTVQNGRVRPGYVPCGAYIGVLPRAARA